VNRHVTAEADGASRAAREDHDSVVKLTRELVRILSRAGADSYGPVLDCMTSWLADNGMTARRLSVPGGNSRAGMRDNRRPCPYRYIPITGPPQAHQ
jgi:succinyl-diaminopimelate desuccinylase